MEQLPDDLTEILANIDKKVYAPDEEYLQIKAELEKWVEWRNQMAKKMKYLSPTSQKIKRLQLVQFDNLIAQAKQKLKLFYEACQNKERADEKVELHDKKMNQHFDELDKYSNRLYIIIKHEKPHLFEEFHRISTQGMTAEELQEFYKHIAYLEETQLDEILTGKE